jgi:hypothetical protein
MLRRQTHATVVLVRRGIEVSSWPLWRDGGPNLEVVDELARLQLAARRLGCSIRLRDLGEELSQLLDLVGLRVEVGWETECREEVGVEEVVMPDDPVA